MDKSELKKTEVELKCKNKGCLKKYKLSENNEKACLYHPGLPIFHDFKKGWTCCKKIVYSWDEFAKLVGCQEGVHNDKKKENKKNNQGEFYQSDTVNRAQRGIDNFGQKEPVFKSIKDFNKEQQIKKEEKKKEEKVKTVFITKNGKMKCSNKGCLKEFTEENNINDCCKYHLGVPVFHDLVKYWSCCKKETWDWDSFMKLPTCSVGKHVPKMK